jgi:DNA-binding PadR family transcriptional regulator
VTRTQITTTNYALLGLLAVRRSWSAYELVGQSRRWLRMLWPRAESKIYESAKRLVELDLATAEHVMTGRRRTTVYSITPAGRRALQAWLRQPGAGPALEFEGAIKLLFADQAGQDDALRTIDAIQGWAAGLKAAGAAIGREFLASDGGPFPERLHVNTLINELLLRHSEMVSDWATWARQQVENWDGTGPQPHRHQLDLDTYRRGACLRDP